MEWTLDTIRQKVKAITGRTDLSDEELDRYINDFYQNRFPVLVHPIELRGIWTATTIPGVGEYPLDENMKAVYPPVMVDDQTITLTRDPGYFFDTYPDRYNASQGKPQIVLFYQNALWFAPIPDREYTIKVDALWRPDALVNASDYPVVQEWGLCIAYGAATMLLADFGDYESAAVIDRMLANEISQIRGNSLRNWIGRRAIGRF